MSNYNIYAFKYAGPLIGSQAMLMWLQDWEKQVQRNYYFWCARSPEQAVVVDAGVTPAVAQEKNLPGYKSPALMLEDIGLAADRIEHLVLTHLHWDHCIGVSLFPRATVYVQEQEFKFWTQDPLARRAPFAALAHPATLDYLTTLQDSGKLVLVEGDQEILPGLTCLLAPGHTPAQQALAVQTDRGTAVLASDCGHLFRNFSEDWPSALISDLPALLKTYDKLRERASSPDMIFPGHDPLMSQNYPAVAQDISQLV